MHRSAQPTYQHVTHTLTSTHSFTRPNGSCVLYDVGSLVDYVLATGSFLEPETRLPLTDADLRHLDALVRAITSHLGGCRG